MLRNALQGFLGDAHFGRVHRYDVMLIFLCRLRLSPMRILDAGSGDGGFACRLAERYPNAQVYGLDLDPPPVPAPCKVTLFQHDLQQALPQECVNQDLITSVEVLQYPDDDVRVLTNLRAAAKPGATLVMHIMAATGRSYDPNFGFRRFLRTVNSQPFQSGQTRSGYSSEHLEQIMRQAGWEMVSQTYTFGHGVMLAHTFFEIYRGWRLLPRILTPLMRILVRPLALRADSSGGAVITVGKAI